MNFDLAKTVLIATLTHDFLRYAIGAGGGYLIINVALADVLRPRKIRKDTPGWPQMRREILVSLRTVAVFALISCVISFCAVAGLLAI